MAERGLCSRREADAFIERGWVFVDGERVTELGTRAAPGLQGLRQGAQAAQRQQMTILMHKPVGYVRVSPSRVQAGGDIVQPETRVQDYVRYAGVPSVTSRVWRRPGRLDIDSTGLLVLTQDGRVARQLIGENSTVDKGIPGSSKADWMPRDWRC